MKRLPFILALFFIAVTLSRVAAFAGDTWTAWAAAFGLTVAVFTSAYFLSRAPSTKRPAFWSLLFFFIVDSLFNLGEVLRWSVETGRWNFVVDFGVYQLPIYRIADLAYGLFPTVSAALLAWLAQVTEHLGPRKRYMGPLWERTLRWVGDVLFGDEAAEPDVTPAEPELEPPEPSEPSEPPISGLVEPNETVIRRYLKRKPDAKLTELMEAADCSKSTASRIRTKIRKEKTS